MHLKFVDSSLIDVVRADVLDGDMFERLREMVDGLVQCVHEVWILLLLQDTYVLDSISTAVSDDTVLLITEKIFLLIFNIVQ